MQSNLQLQLLVMLKVMCAQVPLQPLMNDLESQTYEVFEKDDTKYVAYENAVHQALTERRVSGHSASTSDAGQSASSTSPVVNIMVVGAGRGPLVMASLRAGASVVLHVSAALSGTAARRGT